MYIEIYSMHSYTIYNEIDIQCRKRYTIYSEVYAQYTISKNIHQGTNKQRWHACCRWLSTRSPTPSASPPRARSTYINMYLNMLHIHANGVSLCTELNLE